MKQKPVFLFFCTIFAVSAVFSQKINVQTPNKLFFEFKKTLPQHYILLTNKVDAAQSAKPFLPADFYSTHIGFFCKEEIRFEKLTKIPFRFRLGSIEECDRMEGKTR